jgi:hypothetical protein
MYLFGLQAIDRNAYFESNAYLFLICINMFISVHTYTLTFLIFQDDPQILLALAWLHNLSQSHSFKIVWDKTRGVDDKGNLMGDNFAPILKSSTTSSEQEEGGGEDGDLEVLTSVNMDQSPQELLLTVVKAWYHIWTQLNESSMSFVHLEVLAPALLSDDDLDLLSSTAPAAVKHLQDAAAASAAAVVVATEGKEEDGEGGNKASATTTALVGTSDSLPKYLWPTANIDNEWCYHQRKALRRYECMRKAHQETDLLQRGLKSLRQLLKPEAQVQVDQCNSALLTLNAKLSEGWKSYTLANLDDLAILAETLDTRITNLDTDILEVWGIYIM